MSILYAGGLWTVFLVFGVSAGYNWALNGPKWMYRALLGAAVFVIVASQFLPETHLFNIRVTEGLNWWKWAILIAIPVFLYAKLVRWLKRKADARDDP
ncbi:MAG: hypothetical protein L3J37_10400 [Rhodobacteraceae bacterium]|nr:hypothetical protein [Paracoccaceae bacterium]